MWAAFLSRLLSSSFSHNIFVCLMTCLTCFLCKLVSRLFIVFCTRMCLVHIHLDLIRRHKYCCSDGTFLRHTNLPSSSNIVLHESEKRWFLNHHITAYKPEAELQVFSLTHYSQSLEPAPVSVLDAVITVLFLLIKRKQQQQKVKTCFPISSCLLCPTPAQQTNPTITWNLQRGS